MVSESYSTAPQTFLIMEVSFFSISYAVCVISSFHPIVSYGTQLTNNMLYEATPLVCMLRSHP